jgi:hypothetical protein
MVVRAMIWQLVGFGPAKNVKKLFVFVRYVGQGGARLLVRSVESSIELISQNCCAEIVNRVAPFLRLRANAAAFTRLTDGRDTVIALSTGSTPGGTFYVPDFRKDTLRPLGGKPILGCSPLPRLINSSPSLFPGCELVRTSWRRIWLSIFLGKKCASGFGGITGASTKASGKRQCSAQHSDVNISRRWDLI